MNIYDTISALDKEITNKLSETGIILKNYTYDNKIFIGCRIIDDIRLFQLGDWKQSGMAVVEKVIEAFKNELKEMNIEINNRSVIMSDLFIHCDEVNGHEVRLNFLVKVSSTDETIIKTTNK